MFHFTCGELDLTKTLQISRTVWPRLLIDSNIQDWMIMFNFSVFDWKYSFWANLSQKINIVSLSWNMLPVVQKIKIVSLNWNLVLRLNRIWRIQWWYSLFPFFYQKYPFFEKCFQKNQNFGMKLKFKT